MFRGHRPDAETLSAYVDGRLDAAAAERLRRHVEGCPACAARLQQLAAVRTSLAAMPDVAPARSFRLRPADVERPSAAAARQTSPWLKAMPALGAAALVLFAVIVAVDPAADGDGSRTATSSESFSEDARIAGSDGSPGQPPEPSVGGTELIAGTPSALQADSGPSQRAEEGQAEDAAVQERSQADDDARGPVAATQPDGASPSDRAPDASVEEGGGGNAGAWRAVQVALVAIAAGAAAATLWVWRRQRAQEVS
jgi:hypothetical protein